MASSFDYNKGKWKKSDEAPEPVQDKYEKMYYPVIKLLSHSTETPTKNGKGASQIQQRQLKEETVPLHQSQTTESMTFADAETVMIESPAKARLIKHYRPVAERKPKTCVEFCTEPVKWNRWKLWVMGLLLMLILLVFAVILTWATTKAIIESRPARDAKVVVFGSLSFLTKNASRFTFQQKRSAGSAVTNYRTIEEMTRVQEKATARRLCRAGSASCRANFFDRIEEEYKFDCVLQDYQSQSSGWRLQDQMEEYVLYNSSLCTWHKCEVFELCCYKSPSQGGTVVVGYSLVLTPRGTCANHIMSGHLMNLGIKIATMLSNSNLHTIIQNILYPQRHSRPSMFSEVRSCVHSVEYDRSRACQPMRNCRDVNVGSSKL